MKSDSDHIGTRIRDVIFQKGLTIEQFASLLDDKPQRVKDVLRGKQRAPADMLQALVSLGDVDVQYVLTGIRIDAAPDARAHVEALADATAFVDNLVRAHELPSRPLLRGALLTAAAGKATPRDTARQFAVAAEDLLFGKPHATHHVSADRGGIAGGRDVSVGAPPRSKRRK